MRQIGYYRVSPSDPSVERQLAALGLGKSLDREFMDLGTAIALPARHRPGFQALLDCVWAGDTVHVTSIDRLGRDILDIHQTVGELLCRGVTVHVVGLGPLGRGSGEPVLAVLAQLADFERQRQRAPADAGRKAARLALATTGLTHRGKASLGRPRVVEPVTVRDWRQAHGASLNQTARHFGISLATVKRAMKSADPPPGLPGLPVRAVER